MRKSKQRVTLTLVLHRSARGDSAHLVSVSGLARDAKYVGASKIVFVDSSAPLPRDAAQNRGFKMIEAQIDRWVADENGFLSRDDHTTDMFGGA